MSLINRMLADLEARRAGEGSGSTPGEEVFADLTIPPPDHGRRRKGPGQSPLILGIAILLGSVVVALLLYVFGFANGGPAAPAAPVPVAQPSPPAVAPSAPAPAPTLVAMATAPAPAPATDPAKLHRLSARTMGSTTEVLLDLSASAPYTIDTASDLRTVTLRLSQTGVQEGTPQEIGGLVESASVRPLGADLIIDLRFSEKTRITGQGVDLRTGGGARLRLELVPLAERQAATAAPTPTPTPAATAASAAPGVSLGSPPGTPSGNTAAAGGPGINLGTGPGINLGGYVEPSMEELEHLINHTATEAEGRVARSVSPAAAAGYGAGTSAGTSAGSGAAPARAGGRARIVDAGPPEERAAGQDAGRGKGKGADKDKDKKRKDKGPGSPLPDLTPAPSVKKDVELDALTAQGTKLAKAGDPHGESALRDVLMARPLDTAARANLVTYLLDAGRPHDATQVAEAGLALKPEDTRIAELAARSRELEGDTAGAVAILSRHPPEIARDPDYHAFRAALLQKRGRHREATGIYRELTRQSPRKGIWWLGLGISAGEQGATAEADQAYHRALADPDLTPEIRTFIGERLTALRRPPP
jgi:MSHA biogenesis protein MshN